MTIKSNLPCPIDSRDPLDAYEATYMTGAEAGAVVYHGKTRTNWQAPLFTGATAVFTVAWSAAHGLGLGLGLGLGAGIALLGLCFAVLRVTVSTKHVHIQYGLIGPKIPLAAIESVEAVVHGYNSLMRWGVSPIGRGEWLYAIAGDDGRAVKIVWRKPGNRRCVHYVGSPDHEQLAAAIRAAMEAA